MNGTSLNDHARNPATLSTASAAPAPDPARDGARVARGILTSRGDGDLIKVVLQDSSRALTAELDTAAELCAYLEQRSSSHTEPLPLP